VFAVCKRRKQQRVKAQALADLKRAEAAKKRRAHAVNQVPDIQRHKQPPGAGEQIRQEAFAHAEKIARAKGEKHQMKGIIPEQAAHVEHVAQRCVSVDDKDDGKQIQRAENIVFLTRSSVVCGHGNLLQIIENML